MLNIPLYYVIELNNTDRLFKYLNKTHKIWIKNLMDFKNYYCQNIIISKKLLK